jgi:hypothetical protein
MRAGPKVAKGPSRSAGTIGIGRPNVSSCETLLESDDFDYSTGSATYSMVSS